MTISKTEELMIEHGLIRRILFAMRRCKTRKQTRDLAIIFKEFSKEHEQSEEKDIFDDVSKENKNAESIIDKLIEQHEAGQLLIDRAIEDDYEQKDIEDFCSMYENHANIEDSIIFPFWQKIPKEEKQGQLEKTYSKYLCEVIDIESEIGISNISDFTV